MNQPPSLPIGEVARRSGLSVDTLRYYEREGLVPEAERTAGGQRRYPEAVLDALQVVSALRSAGFGISPIRQMMQVKDGEADAPELLRRAETVLTELQRELEQRQTALDHACAVVASMRQEIDDYRAAHPGVDD